MASSRPSADRRAPRQAATSPDAPSRYPGLNRSQEGASAAILGIGAAGSAGLAFSEGCGSVNEVAIGVVSLILPVALYLGLGAAVGTAGPERRRQLAETLGIGELPQDQIGYRPLGGGG